MSDERDPYKGSDDLERDRAEAHRIVEGQQRRAEWEANRGAERIAAERRRQIMAEGWSPAHDAEHINGELRDAAIAYLMATDDRAGANAVDVWPWHLSWWKPKDAISNLVRAGALIAAEIDRIQARDALHASSVGVGHGN